MKEVEKTIILIYRAWGLRSILRPLWRRENWRAPVCRQPLDTRVMQSAYIQEVSIFPGLHSGLNIDRRPHVLYIKMIVFSCSFIWLSQNFSCGYSISFTGKLSIIIELEVNLYNNHWIPVLTAQIISSTYNN